MPIIRTSLRSGRGTGSIANEVRAEKELNLPLPEMTFGNNYLSLIYQPGPSSKSSGSKGVKMEFNGLNALSEVGTGEGWEERTGGAVQVSMAETWGKNRYATCSCPDTRFLLLKLYFRAEEPGHQCNLE